MPRIYIPTFGEEVGNTITHGVMSVIALFAIPLATLYSYINGQYDLTASISVSIFAISIFLMFLISTLYHCMSPQSRHKDVFHILDHIFIYVAIAGSYTPVALTIIGGWQGIVICIIQWVMVIAGVLYKSLSSRSIPALSLTIYLIMGWTIVFFLPLFIKSASLPFIIYIAAGGVCYTVGAVIYAIKGFRYHHMVWHLLIDIAAVLHYIGIVFYL